MAPRCKKKQQKTLWLFFHFTALYYYLTIIYRIFNAYLLYLSHPGRCEVILRIKYLIRWRKLGVRYACILRVTRDCYGRLVSLPWKISPPIQKYLLTPVGLKDSLLLAERLQFDGEHENFVVQCKIVNIANSHWVCVLSFWCA